MRRTRAAQAWVLTAIASSVALGCGGGAGEADGPAALSSRGSNRGPRPTTPEPVEAQPQPTAPSASGVTPMRPPSAPTAAPVDAEKPEAKAEEEPERDLPAELVRGVGDVASCVKPRLAGSGPTSLSVSVSLEATLTENGIVTRSGARSSALDASELDCIRKRLDALRLTGPIEDAPRTVTATVSLTLQAPKPPAGAPAAPDTAASAPAPAAPGYP